MENPKSIGKALASTHKEAPDSYNAPSCLIETTAYLNENHKTNTKKHCIMCCTPQFISILLYRTSHLLESRSWTIMYASSPPSFSYKNQRVKCSELAELNNVSWWDSVCISLLWLTLLCYHKIRIISYWNQKGSAWYNFNSRWILYLCSHSCCDDPYQKTTETALQQTDVSIEVKLFRSSLHLKVTAD